MDYLNYLLLVINNFSILGYFIIVVLAFFESFAFIGLIVPGSIALIIGGFLASQGTLSIYYLFIFSALGAILGDSFSFYLGRKGLISFNEKNKIFKPVLLERGKKFFKKYGNKSVFSGRFIGWVRPVIPFIAGLFKMDRNTFLFWNILSGLIWSVVHIFVGYFFGEAIKTIQIWSLKVTIFFLLLFLLVVLIWFFIRKRRLFFHFLK